MQTLCRLMQTCAHNMQTLCRLVVICRAGKYAKGLSGKFPYCALDFAGPTWRKRDGSVLVAPWRFDGSRSRKTKGLLADTLQCNIWCRAQTPHQMTHVLHGGETNNNGFAALGKAIGTPDSTDKYCAYVTEHPVLKYLRPKLANFLDDFFATPTGLLGSGCLYPTEGIIRSPKVRFGG
jgi:hypothetical protein